MHAYVQIVSTPTADTPGACLMLHFDNRRYLFGRIGEGTQRLLNQRKLSLAKIHDIFLTGCIDWECTGGLLGMILTLAELKTASKADQEQANEKRRVQGKKREIKAAEDHLNVHGGRNLVHMLATARRFIFRKALPVLPRELRLDPRSGDSNKVEPDYKDENIHVWSIPVIREKGRKAAEATDAEDAADAETSGERSPKKRKLSPASSFDGNAHAEETPNQWDVEQGIREAVVKDMFGSKWNLDTLRELKLKDVQLPAKIFVRNDKGHIEPYSGPLPNGSSGECPDIKVLVRLPWPASKVEQLPPTRPSGRSMCYIIKTHPRRGKFDVAAATRLGVVKTDFKKLTAGESVPGKDGVVTPGMVMGSSVEGRGFAIVDIPWQSILNQVLERHEWSDAEIMKGIDAMYWILGESVALEDPRVQQFMRVHSSIKHIVLGKDVNANTLALESPATQLIKMNRIDPDRFPLPLFNNIPDADLPASLDGSSVEVGRCGGALQLAPKVAFQSDNIIPLMDTSKPIGGLGKNGSRVLSLTAAARSKIRDPIFLQEVDKSQEDLPCPDAEIVPLGTGSAMPSKYRNVSSTLIRVPGWGSYLLDCGENTLGQLRRCFGYQQADDILRDLRAIYISHSHADHHLGTVGVIARWRELQTDRKLAIIAPSKYHQFMREFHEVQDLSQERLMSVTFYHGPSRQSLQVSYPEGVTDPATLGLPRIEACLVDHCHEAMAVVLTFPDTGLKIAYSGDCRPSAEFARLGQGAHLLLHECTFDDELRGDALAKKHSTLSEALDVGRRMQARRILLTHFSQRYPKLPNVNEEALKGNGDAGRDVEVLFAFDMMKVRLGEFKQAAQFLPALRMLLKEWEKEEEIGDGGKGEEEEE
jgi:ribonuclease Z